MLGPQFGGDTDAWRGVRANSANDGGFKDGLHALEDAFGGFGFVEPDRCQDVEDLGRGHIGDWHATDAWKDIGFHGRGPLLEVLGIGQLLLALRERNIKHLSECGQAKFARALFDA